LKKIINAEAAIVSNKKYILFLKIGPVVSVPPLEAVVDI
jgi:hypothetical protein